MDFECDLGIIAPATGEVIARAIASAIYDCCECNMTKWHENTCDSYTSRHGMAWLQASS